MRRSFVNITVEERGTNLFCILPPVLRKPDFCFKASKTRDLRPLANKVLQRHGRGMK
jgi:hypothetical protein